MAKGKIKNDRSKTQAGKDRKPVGATKSVATKETREEEGATKSVVNRGGRPRSDYENRLISRVYAMELLNISGPTFDKLNVKRDAASKLWREQDCVHTYVGYLKDLYKNSPRVAAKGRLEEAKAKEAEMKVAVREGELIDFQEHLDLFNLVFGSLKSALTDIGVKATKGTKNQALRADIEGLVNEALNKAISDWNAGRGKSEDADPDIEAGE